MKTWYLLIHNIPPRPLYLRAKIRQRLERIGAVALKNSVYALPEADDALEDLQWLAGEIVAGGGQAFIVAGKLVSGMTEKDLVAAFRAARAPDYDALLREMRSAPDALAKHRGRFTEIRAIDFFHSPKRQEAEQMLAKLERKQPRPQRLQMRNRPSAGIWITRRGIRIDRIASAWLVRRFIDADAKFRFVDPQSWTRRKGEIAFDMTGGDYSHEGNRCTFETIIAAFKLRDAALKKIAEIVHDIDLKEELYGRAETAGVRQLIEGIIATHAGDEERMARGLALFDDLYSAFGKRRT